MKETDAFGRWSPQALLLNPGKLHKAPAFYFAPESLAERSNLWKMTALGYEPFWRRFSSTLLTGNRWNVKDECRHMIQLLQPSENEILVDAGCSTGLYARVILEEKPDASVILLDYSQHMLMQAVKLMPEGNNASFLACDAASVPIYSDAVDGIVMGGTLNELTRPDAVLTELSRLLKHGGRAVVMFLATESKTNSVLLRLLSKGGIWVPAVDFVCRLFDKAGFEIREKREAGLMRIVRLELKQDFTQSDLN